MTEFFPDGNTRDNDSSRTYPYIFADMDWLIVLHGFFAKSWIDGVVRCGNGYIRPEHDFVININVPIVHQCEIEIGIHTVSEMNIFSHPSLHEMEAQYSSSLRTRQTFLSYSALFPANCEGFS